MAAIARMLWDALCGGLIAVGLMRIAFALGASGAADPATSRTEAAPLLSGLVGIDLYLTDEQMMLLRLMTTLVIGLAALWGIARALSLTGAVAR